MSSAENPAAHVPAHAGEIVSDIPLPSFIVRRDDGLWVDITAMDSPDLLVRFVERVFTANACFAGLDYASFCRLLFESQPKDIEQLLQYFEQERKPPLMRIARDLVTCPPSRHELYRGLSMKSDGDSAEYFFEPVSIDREEDGRVVSTLAELNFDEFVAAMWLKGLRYGIDEATVRSKLAEGKSERLCIATMRQAVAGEDASVAESAKTLRRSDAPRLRSDGRVDLAKFENRFPQVSVGQRLFKKLPSVAGVPGRDVRGKELPPEPVKDFALTELTGKGTRIEHVANDGDYVIATIDGFLTIDAATGHVSVDEKIINRAGVSARTTGNLSLSGQQYEEHGEVQEKRLVEGHDMSFFADVFGNVSSDGGRILIKKSLAGGSAKNLGGEIIVEGSASRASIENKSGEVRIKAAESCLIVARKVVIERASLCDIVADEVEIGDAEGCAIAAKKITIKTCAARRSEASMLSVLLPDFSQLDKSLKDASAKMTEFNVAATSKREQLAALSSDADMKTYLSIQPRIKAREMVLSGEQDANWQKLLVRIAPKLRDFARLNTEMQDIRKRANELTASIAALKQSRAEAIAQVSCQLDTVTGETLVRIKRSRIDEAALITLPAKELRVRLREAGNADERLFSGESGAFTWPQEE